MPILRRIGLEIRQITNIADSVDTESAAARIKSGIPFKGVNAWILAFSVVIASVGLNINSVAVIIGAMLISPLLGPIFGIGLGLGTNDTELLKTGVKNFLVMVSISLLAAFVYFLITPLNLSNPTELESRTSPTIYDVLIALFGGLAGIFEMSRKEKGTVLSGVAIATALMPPLCTAGYGLANLNMQYFTGAMFLFVINSVFIVLATYVMVKYLGFKEAYFLDEKTARKARRVITIVVLLVIVPSTWSAIVMIKENNFRQDIETFVRSNKTFSGGYIYDYDIDTKDGLKATIYVTGGTLDANKKSLLLDKAKESGIPEGKIDIREHSILNAQQSESENIVKGIFERTDAELGRKEVQLRELEKELEMLKSSEIPYVQITKEVKAQYPGIRELVITSGAAVSTDSLSQRRCKLVLVQTEPALEEAQLQKLADWLRIRLEDSTLVVLNK